MSAGDAPPLVSVCVLAWHGHGALRGCLESLRAQEGGVTSELVVGVSDRHTAEVVREVVPDAVVLPVEEGPPGRRRNILVERARGELLLFLDDDVTVAPDLLRRLAESAARWPRVAVFGGPNETPVDSSSFQAVQGAVLSSLVGSGPVSRRYGARRAGTADERWFTLCNLAVRRRAMVRFDPDLVCAEENAVLAELRERGALMRYEPDLRVFHTRRPTWLSFARQMFKYGRGRGQLTVRRPRESRVAFLLPSLLVLYAILVAGLTLGGVTSGVVLGGVADGPLLIPLALYGVVVVVGAFRIALTLRSAAHVAWAGLLILTVHLFYGVGVMRGMLEPGGPWGSESQADGGPSRVRESPRVERELVAGSAGSGRQGS